MRAARLLGASEAVCLSLELTLDPFELALHRWSVGRGGQRCSARRRSSARLGGRQGAVGRRGRGVRAR